MPSSLLLNAEDSVIRPKRRLFQTIPLISDLLHAQERRRRGRNSRVLLKNGRRIDRHETDQPNLDGIQIPSCTLFTAADDCSFLTKLDSLDGKLPKNRIKSARAKDSESSLPTIVHPPAAPPSQKSASSPSKPTRSILKSPSNPRSCEHTSEADTRANTTRNVLLTSAGSPNIKSLRGKLASIKRRRPSLSMVPYLQPLSPAEKKVLVGAIADEALPVTECSNNDNDSHNSDVAETGPQLPSDTRSPDQKKTVRFDHVDIHPYVATQKLKRKKGARKRDKVDDNSLVEAE